MKVYCSINKICTQLDIQSMCQMISYGTSSYYEWLTLCLISIVRHKCFPILRFTDITDFYQRSEASNDKCVVRGKTVWSCQTWLNITGLPARSSFEIVGWIVLLVLLNDWNLPEMKFLSFCHNRNVCWVIKRINDGYCL